MGPTRVTRRVLSVHSIVKLLLLLSVFRIFDGLGAMFLKLHGCEPVHVLLKDLHKVITPSHYALTKKHGHSLQTFVDSANKSWLVIFTSVRVMVQ